MVECSTKLEIERYKVINRERDPRVIDTLSGYFIEDQCYSTEVMADEFKDMMIYSPDDIYVLTGYYKETLVAFLIAYVVGDRNYALLSQAWSYAGKIDSAAGFGVIENWCKELGLNELRYETSNPVAKAMGIKRYGFHEIGVIMTKEL